MENIYSSGFRQLAGKTFTVTKVYAPYRSGYIKATNSMESFVLKDGERCLRTWNDEARAFDYTTDKKVDYKVHKKVYDVVIECENQETITTKKGEITDNEFTIRGLSANKVGMMCAATVAFGKVPEKDGKPVYDREEKFTQELEGQDIVFAVTGEWLDTKYTFKQGINTKKAAEEVADEEEWLPFRQ